MTDTPTDEAMQAATEAVMNQLLAKDEDLPTITLEEFRPVNRSNTEEQIIDADVEIVNAMLSIAHKGWGGVRTLGGVKNMVDTTLKLIEGRRKVLGKPYGYINKSEGPGTVEVPE